MKPIESQNKREMLDQVQSFIDDECARLIFVDEDGDVYTVTKITDEK